MQEFILLPIVIYKRGQMDSVNYIDFNFFYNEQKTTLLPMLDLQCFCACQMPILDLASIGACIELSCLHLIFEHVGCPCTSIQVVLMYIDKQW